MSLSFLGDFFIENEIEQSIVSDKYILNLEAPISKQGEPQKSKINLRMPSINFEKIFGSNPVAVNLANNHIMDYGEEAYKDTISFLESRKIKYFGAGIKENNYNNPCILDYCGKKIGLFAYCCESTQPIMGSIGFNGCAELNLNKIKEDLDVFRNKVDFVILNFHWGEEEIQYPKPKDVKIARECIDHGADMIIGHHAHVIQSSEVYRGKHIFYGIGNFAFMDLDIPAFFDGKKFTSHFKKIQNIENSKSLVIQLSEYYEIDYKQAQFCDLEISHIHKKLPKWVPENQMGFYFFVAILKRYRMISRFIKNPRRIRFNNIKNFIGIR